MTGTILDHQTQVRTNPKSLTQDFNESWVGVSMKRDGSYEQHHTGAALPGAKVNCDEDK